MIKNTALWLTAYSRFSGFQLHLPLYPHEKHVEEYHSIIDDFQKASDHDFSAFRIRASELSLIDYRPPLIHYESAVPGFRYCDQSIFRARVSGLVRFIVTIAQMHTGRVIKDPPKNPPSPKPDTPSIYIAQMHGSQFIANSPNASIKNNFNPKAKEFRELIDLIKKTIPELNLDAIATKQINADLSTVEAQIESPAPKYTVIGESFTSIRSILEGVAANIATNALFLGISRYFS